MTIPNREDLILVGNPNKRTSKLVYVLADRAEYRILDISEIPFVTLATTRNIISTPTPLRFRQPSNDFQFTFGTQGTAAMAAPQSLIHAQTPPATFQFTFGTQGTAAPQSLIYAQTPPATFSLPVTTAASPQPRQQSEPQPEVASPVAACITTITSYFASQEDRTAQKRSRENALDEDQAMEPKRRRLGGPDYCRWVYGRLQALLAM